MAPVHVRVIEKGAARPAGRIVSVNAPPPAPMPEEAPSHGADPSQVWLAGHWRYYAGHYVWINGRWEAPPRSHARYVPTHWEKHGESYWFFEGYWQVL